MARFKVIAGDKKTIEKSEKREKINQSVEIDNFDTILTKTQDEINRIKWYEIPAPPMCSIESEQYIEESHQWTNAVNKAWEKIEALKMKIGAIYSKAERELERDNYKKLLRRRHVKINDAQQEIDDYTNLKNDIEKGISEIHLAPVDARYGHHEPEVKLYRGNGNRPDFRFVIIYEDEEELHDQIREALNKYHYYEDVVKQIEKEIEV